MVARLLDGTKAAAEIKAELRTRVAALAEQGVVPGLATVLVGDDPGSQWYVAGKHKDCAEVGIASLRRDLPDSVSQEELENVLLELNEDLQAALAPAHPLPSGWREGWDELNQVSLQDPCRSSDAHSIKYVCFIHSDPTTREQLNLKHRML